MANVTAGLFQGLNVAGSLSKSSVNDASGAKSEMASLPRVKHEVMELLEKDGMDKIMGRDHIHNKVVDAVQWFTQKKKPVTKNDR